MLNKKITTEKRLSVRLYLSLFIYAVVGYGLVVLLDYIFSKSDNSILAWLHLRTDVIFIVYLIMGFVCIFNFFWKTYKSFQALPPTARNSSSGVSFFS